MSQAPATPLLLLLLLPPLIEESRRLPFLPVSWLCSGPCRFPGLWPHKPAGPRQIPRRGDVPSSRTVSFPCRLCLGFWESRILICIRDTLDPWGQSPGLRRRGRSPGLRREARRSTLGGLLAKMFKPGPLGGGRGRVARLRSVLFCFLLTQ